MASAFLDDLVIYSSCWKDYVSHIHLVLESLLWGVGLTVKLSKRQFGMAKCLYMGHVIGSGGVEPEVSKVAAVNRFETPKTKTQVPAFLGITGYYRWIIPNYAAMALPLTELTEKCAPTQVIWTTQCEAAFQELKRLLCSAPILASPDFDKPFILQTDASEYGVGAVLSQHDKHGRDHPIAYFSRKLLPRGVRYSTVEKECFTIKLGMEMFRVYVLGRKFTVEMDHRSLIWLDKLKESNSRLTCWSLALQPFSYTVTHWAGMNNGNADVLSRAGKEERAVTTNQFVAGGGWSVMEWERASSSTREISRCVQLVTKTDPE